jgi:hypothetical protein
MLRDDISPFFDVRQSVHRRLIIQIFVMTTIGTAMVYYGWRLIPESFGLHMSIYDIRDLGFWSIVGVFLVGTGIYNLVAAIYFAFRSRKSSGHWHFRLTADDLLWHVPCHCHGTEAGFHNKLSDIKQVEFKTITRDENFDLRSYWIHFNGDTPSIELKSYSGISLSWLVQKLADAGVPYNETRKEY